MRGRGGAKTGTKRKAKRREGTNPSATGEQPVSNTPQSKRATSRSAWPVLTLSQEVEASSGISDWVARDFRSIDQVLEDGTRPLPAQNLWEYISPLIQAILRHGFPGSEKAQRMFDLCSAIVSSVCFLSKFRLRLIPLLDLSEDLPRLTLHQPPQCEGTDF